MFGSREPRGLEESSRACATRDSCHGCVHRVRAHTVQPLYRRGSERSPCHLALSLQAPSQALAATIVWLLAGTHAACVGTQAGFAT